MFAPRDRRHVSISEGGVFVDSRDGAHLLTSYEKMSKSKHNGVDPLDALRRDGIDLTRLQLLDNAAPRSPINWGETGIAIAEGIPPDPCIARVLQMRKD